MYTILILQPGHTAAQIQQWHKEAHSSSISHQEIASDGAGLLSKPEEVPANADAPAHDSAPAGEETSLLTGEPVGVQASSQQYGSASQQDPAPEADRSAAEQEAEAQPRSGARGREQGADTKSGASLAPASTAEEGAQQEAEANSSSGSISFEDGEC